MKKYTLSITLLIGFVLGFSTGILWNSKHSHEHLHTHDHDSEESTVDYITISPDDLEKEGVHLKNVTNGKIQSYLTVYTKILTDPRSIYQLSPKITGVIQKIYKQNGDTIEKDEPIFLLSSSDVAEKSIQYHHLQSQLETLEEQLNKESKLYEKKLITQKDLNDTKTKYLTIHTEWEKTKEYLSYYDVDLNNLGRAMHGEYLFRSPFSGKIALNNYQVGQYINSDSPAVIVADLSKLKVEIPVYAKNKNKFIPNTTFSFTDLEGDKGEGEVYGQSPLINENNQIIFYASIPNDEKKWHPGEYIKIVLPTVSQEANFIVPKTAIQEIDGSASIFKKVNDLLKIQPVKLGIEDEDNIEIVDGLSENDTIAYGNTFFLKAEFKKHEAEHEH